MNTSKIISLVTDLSSLILFNSPTTLPAGRQAFSQHNFYPSGILYVTPA
jgi:hypothetical protein